MEKFYINGGAKLSGSLEVSSAKNALLPIISACLLTDDEVIIEKCPQISDVVHMRDILIELGCSARFEEDNLIICCASAGKSEIPSNLARVLRSSIFMLGSIISRFKEAKVAYPGGCDIGLRPIDLHLKGLRAVGVNIKEENGMIYCKADKIKGNKIYLDCPSVGATENIMLASVFAEGTTIIENAAKEPEITDLQNFINKMGGKVSGGGTSRVEIEGVKKLHGVKYTTIPDRIEAGTFLIAAAMTGGEIELTNCNYEHIYSLIDKMRDSTCKITYKSGKIYLKSPSRLLTPQIIETMPYPAFPTDLQAQMVALSSVAEGCCIIIENMFESRYKHIAELKKMGANITVRDRIALVRGVKTLHGASVSSTDLRGGASLVLAGLVAEGTTDVGNIELVDRGYYNFADKLSSIGADIKRR